MPKQTAVTKFNAALQAAKTQIEESSYLKIAVFENKIKEIEQKKLTASEIPDVQELLSDLKKQIEHARKIYSEPLNLLFKKNNSLYSPLTKRIDTYYDFLKKSYQEWIDQEEERRLAENADREQERLRLMEIERQRVKAENEKRLKKGKPPIQSGVEIIAPPTPPTQFDKSAARKDISVMVLDFKKLVIAIAANIDNPTWYSIISGYKTQPIKDIASQSVRQETIDMFAAAGVKIKYVPTMEAWGATD